MTPPAPERGGFEIGSGGLAESMSPAGRAWRIPPRMHPDADVVLIHGLGDHARALSQEFCAEALERAGFRVARFDLPGHGQRARSDTSLRWSDCQAELARCLRGLPTRPVFLVGISLGGLLALQHALRAPTEVAAVVAAAPALDPEGAPWLVRRVVPLLARFFPRLPVNPRLDLSAISRDTALAARCLADPLARRSFPVSLLAGIMEAMEECQARAGELAVPTLLLQGLSDRIVPPAGARRFAQRAGARVDLRHYPEALHNLFVETNRAEVFADLTNWLARCGRDFSNGHRPARV